METRKLQKVGGSTYTVSVPKSWAVEHHLDAGSSVYIYTYDDGTLAVRSTDIDEKALESTTINVSSSAPTQVKRALHAAYASGFKEVTLTTDEEFTSEQRRAATSVSNSLVGTEVIKETETKITMQNFLDSAEVALCQTVSQLQFLVTSILQKATEAVTKHLENDEHRVLQRGDEVARLADMVTHHLSRSLTSLKEVDQLGIGRRAVFECYFVAQQLRSVTDCAENLVQTVAWADAAVPDDMLEEVHVIATGAQEVVERATSSVITDASVETAQQVLADHDDVLEKAQVVEAALFESDDPDSYVLVQILQRLSRATQAGGRIADVALERAVRP